MTGEDKPMLPSSPPSANSRKRRGRSEGSIHQRGNNGLWVACRSLPVGPGGRRRRLYAYARTKLEALQKLSKLILVAGGDVEAGLPDCNLTVAEYLDTWYEQSGYQDWTDRSRARDRSMINQHLKVHLGHLRLDEVGPDHVEKMLSGLRSVRVSEAGEQRELSSRTKQVCFDILNRALQLAVDRERIAVNPCKTVTRPKGQAEEIRFNPSMRTKCAAFWRPLPRIGFRRSGSC